MEKSKIIKEVCDFLEERKIPAARLAEVAGVSPVLISRIRTGVRSNINSSSADKLREAMYKIRTGKV